jgi:hypothetical protein
MTIMDYSGRIVALSGGAGEKTRNRGLNRAVDSPRQPGSSVKPISTYAPAIEEKKLTEAITTYKLAYPAANAGTSAVPAYKITVCTLTRDGAVDKTFKVGQATDKGVCTYTAGTQVLTFAEGDLVAGDKLYIQYEYSTANCVVVYNSADKFAKAMEIIVEVVGHDICNVSTAYSGFVIFPNATLSASTTVSFGREDSFDFSFSASQDYCSDEKELFRIVVPQPAQ